MAKTRAPRKKPEEPLPAGVVDPKRVHELFGLVGPYDTQELPVPTKDYVTFWDCGVSINELRRRQKALFPYAEWLDGQAFAKQSDSWKWRQINVTPFGLGESFDPAMKLRNGDDLPFARELVAYLVLHFLATGCGSTSRGCGART